ncbi:MAG: response regulator [Oligoflexia bacterium]|nr:response regulator [Oligoflexia bacterium]
MLIEKLIVPKIAILDDEAHIVDILYSYIKDDFPNLEIFTYTDGTEALKDIASKKINIIILDVNLPRLHGQSVFKQCLGFSHGCKVIMISGETSYTNVLSAFCDGASGFIYKPFERKEVISSVKMCLEQINYWNEVLSRTVARKSN